MPGACFVSARYDHHAMRDGDFRRCGIEMPAQLGRATARRQAEFLAGRLCARHALHGLNGVPDSPATLEGRRAPQWPLGCVGSITHSDGWAGALVAKQRAYLGVGVDVERLLDPAEALRLGKDILTAGEWQRLHQLSPSCVGLAVTLTFSLKESLFKALYPLVEQDFYFEHAELAAWDGAGAARMRLLCDLGPHWQAGRELHGQFCQHQGRILSLVAVGAATAFP